MTTDSPIRVRFAPSPTGYLHIGGARTTLFNWLLARKHGGKMVLRIEDTDRTRHVEDSLQKILADLRWLGMDWDEGPEVGGDAGPYFQSERLPIYQEHMDRLLASGDAYYALETQEELETMREAARNQPGGWRYPRPNPLPTVEEGEAARQAGRPVVVRLKMPAEDIVVVDQILGEVSMPADQHEDFVIQKSDGWPTYHFACVIDDELMGITDVLRGQEHLMNTPKHIALQRALGFGTPRYAHLPVIFNMSGSKMSKRDKEKALARGEEPPEIDVHDFRAAGYLPEAVINFIALLGWSSGEEREFFSAEELIAAFSVERIGKTNARFDREKLLSFNTDWAARLDDARLQVAFADYVQVSESPFKGASEELRRDALRACAGFRTFADVDTKAGFLCLNDDALTYDAKAVKKVLIKGEGAGYAMLDTLRTRLAELGDWTAEAIEGLLEVICNEQDVKLGKVAQPLRVAVSGGTISPSIHETLIMLGREHTLARIDRCLAERAS
jgi:glutamyl-tRNA synthetase